MINFGNTNTWKDAANLVLHVARLKAQHYARKSCTKTKIPPNSRKFYADFAIIFWKTGKIATYLLFLNVWGLVRKILALTHPISTVSRIKPREILHRRHFFHTKCFLHYSKVRLPKYCGKRALQGREKSWDMSTYRVPKCGRHFVKFDDVTTYPVLVVARTAWNDLAIIEWGRVGYEEFCRSRRVLFTEAEGRGG